MDPHLKGIPCLRTLATWSLSSGNLEGLGRETNRSLYSEILGLGAFNELLANFLKGGDLAAGEGDADFVSFLQDLSDCATVCLLLCMNCSSTNWAFAELFLGLLVRHIPFTTRTLCYGKVMKVD